MRKVVLNFILFYFVTIISISSHASTNKLIWECTNSKSDCWSNDKCNAYAFTNTGKKVLLFHGNTFIMCHSNLKTYPNNIGELAISCGTACKTSIFINMQSGEVSQPINSVMAINVMRKVVAAVNKDKIEIISIFDKPTKYIAIRRKFTNTPIPELAIDQIKFMNNNKIFLSYFSNENKNVKETVPIDYKIFR